jgi:hypothetical protein
MNQAAVDLKRAALPRHTLSTLAFLGCVFAATGAHAACHDPRAAASGAPSHMSFVKATDGGDDQGNVSIVGLWHVVYSVDGQLFYEAFDTWHADGTEIESANASPLGGNVCMGVWKQAPSGLVKLNHIGWDFDGMGNSAGYFTITEKNTVGPKGNTYTGTFTYSAYDQNGVFQGDISGTLTATRISVY